MTPKALMRAALNHRAVIHRGPGFTDKPMPAAFVAPMQFNRVMALLPHLKLYKPKKK